MTRHRYHQIRKAQQKIDEPKWHEAVSEMLIDEEPLQTPWVDRWVDIEPRQLFIVARRPEIVQVTIGSGSMMGGGLICLSALLYG